ncbi:hypothetical protein FQN60_006530 [Etheostoma spectabile]|uniref:Uncharacterized protein n=1 Tax=Etheostoma spectabile TaxID=54343 RepID=A0A5J5CCF7_9PERO|nr:hypothetical protein FQN60_006530 [Etheostoma spectabile]
MLLLGVSFPCRRPHSVETEERFSEEDMLQPRQVPPALDQGQLPAGLSASLRCRGNRQEAGPEEGNHGVVIYKLEDRRKVLLEEEMCCVSIGSGLPVTPQNSA